MRVFLLDHAAALPLPSHRAEGLGASMTLHLSVFALLVSAPGNPAGGVPSRLAVTFVAETPGTSGDTTQGEAPPRAAEETPADGPASSGAITDFALALPDFQFDITKVGRAANLFPFLTDPLLFLDDVRAKYRTTPDKLYNPFGRERRPSTHPPLTATEEELQEIVDRAWSRRERWTNFAEIAKLLTTHDPQDGDAFVVMHQYLEQNLLQPYYDSETRDPRFWVMLGLAADHARLVEFVADFVRDHPSSRTTTELLFMLDEFAQASRDTLLMLLSTDPRTHLNDTREASTAAYEIANRVHRQYDAVARDRKLRDTRSIRRHFDDLRLRILATIVETTPDGYGATDARFLAGRILWDQNQPKAALEWWRDLGPDGRNAYSEASSAILEELEIPDERTAAEISRILGLEYRRWLTYSEQRLRQFGYAFDTF